MATKRTTRHASDESTPKGSRVHKIKKGRDAAWEGERGETRAHSTGSTRGSSGTGGAGGPVRVEREIGGRTLSLETGRMAKLADGAIVARYGDTVVLATAQSAKEREDIDFFPLTVEYREKPAAAGKFPGGFFKREGRPSTKEILGCRVIDRAIRPLFPEGYRAEVQVLSQVLATDLENESDTLAAVASFAALAVSSIPHRRALGAVRIGTNGDELVVNPTWSQLHAPECQLNLTVAAHKDGVVMVEAGARQISEKMMLEAIMLGHRVSVEIAGMIEELVKKAGKAKQAFVPPTKNEALEKEIERKFGKPLRAVPVAGGDKQARKKGKDQVLEQVKAAFPAPATATDKERKQHEKAVMAACEAQFERGERESILDGRRADGRDLTTIRPISIEVGPLPRVHGSTLFTRGETQALVVTTLGTADDEQMLDGIYPEGPKRFLLHYNFPPFSVGEVRRIGSVGRREIGHGALAERALEIMLPEKEKFPYTIRLTSEILESNGSSSMATVCGGTLALMDAGVPIQQPVAGVAMGLVKEGDRIAILSDILGSEDHCGDMDFKVAGSGRGITALQMDIKCEGLSREIFEQALEQAREGRKHVLQEMLKALRRPRDEVSPNAPRLITLKIPVDKIGLVIGPSGKMIRGLQEEFQVKINIENDGSVTVAGANMEKVDACVKKVKDMTAEVEVGAVYKGRVSAIKEFGAFVEILPGQEGLVHVSELSNEFIRSVTDVVRIGDELEVKVIGIDDFGKVKLSRRALLAGATNGEGGEGGDGGRRHDRRPEPRSDRPDRGSPRRDVTRGAAAAPEEGDSEPLPVPAADVDDSEGAAPFDAAPLEAERGGFGGRGPDRHDRGPREPRHEGGYGRGPSRPREGGFGGGRGGGGRGRHGGGGGRGPRHGR